MNNKNHDILKRFDDINEENKELRGKVEFLNVKTTNLEKENVRLYAQSQDKVTISNLRESIPGI